MEPGYADGWVNVARAPHPGGQHGGRGARSCARPWRSTPNAGQDALLPGLGAEGPAAGTTRPSTTCARARALYPRDRVVLNQIGRMLFLKRRYTGRRSRSFSKVLAVDPEDLQAHYNLMLCWQGLGDARDGAARAGALRALQGGRVRAVHHRPVPPAPPAGQQRAPVDPRAPARCAGHRAHGSRAAALIRIAKPRAWPRGPADESARSREARHPTGAARLRADSAGLALLPQRSLASRSRT